MLDGSDTAVLFSGAGGLDEATDVRLAGNERVADMFQKAGVDLEQPRRSTWPTGKPATASFTTTSPALQATAPENAVDGATISGLPIQQGDGYIARNPIWGTLGSPNAEDWLEVDLGVAQRVDEAKLYFYSNKNFGVGGNTYREPASFAVQYHDGSGWVDAGAREPAGAELQPRRLPGGGGAALARPGDADDGLRGRGQGAPALRSGRRRAARARWEARCRPTLSLTVGGPASLGAFTPGVARDYETTLGANVISTAGEATLTVHDPAGTGRLVNGSFALREPLHANGAAIGGDPLVLRSYPGPVSNDAVTIALRQSIAANEPLRTGRYSKALTFTLSTSTP